MQKAEDKQISVKDTDSYTALFNGGWNKRRLAEIGNSANDADRNRNVVVYRFDVTEFGTYRVEVSIRAFEKDLTNLSVFAGRRNMIDLNITVRKGEQYERSFYQAVFPYIPALSSKRIEDKCIYVSVAGVNASDLEKALEVKIIREDVPVVWVAGDSTVTDQIAGIPYYPYGSCAGWAQILSRYIKKAAVCNLAHSGMTSNCFRDDGHYAICQEFMKTGDFFIMQFGHNDQKRRNLSAFCGYYDNLKRYVSKVRNKGAEPIICSPISRIPLKLSAQEAAELSMPVRYSLLTAYADAARKVAEELKVCFVDLHKMTFDKWVELGDKAHDYFMPGDITHTNEYGAVLICDFFVEAMKQLYDKGYSNVDQGDGVSGPFFGEFLSDSDTRILPKEQPGPSIFDIEPPYVDIKKIPEYEDLAKALRYALLDPCVMYLHPYDTMPRGQLLMVMFAAFRMAGVRPYKKKFVDIKVDEWISGYVQALIENDLIDYSTYEKVQPDESLDSDPKFLFRPDAPLTFEELSQFLVLKLERKKYANYTARAIELGLVDVNLFDAEKSMNRAQVYITLTKFMDIGNLERQDLPSDSEIHPVH